jgi:hypothetical protein
MLSAQGDSKHSQAGRREAVREAGVSWKMMLLGACSLALMLILIAYWWLNTPKSSRTSSGSKNLNNVRFENGTGNAQTGPGPSRPGRNGR